MSDLKENVIQHFILDRLAEMPVEPITQTGPMADYYVIELPEEDQVTKDKLRKLLSAPEKITQMDDYFKYIKKP